MSSEIGGLVQSECDEQQRNCKPVPFSIPRQWLKYFITRDPDFDISAMTEEQFWGYMHISRQRYDSIIGTNDADLSEFREFGGKMISWWVQTLCSCARVKMLTDLQARSGRSVGATGRQR